MTFKLPRLSALSSLLILSTRFRILADASLSPTFINSLLVETTDAPVCFHRVRCGSIELTNRNRLDPDTTKLKNLSDSVSGTYEAESSIKVTCENGGISGSFVSEGKMEVETRNATISGSFKAGGSLTVLDRNAPILGTFIAGKDLVVSNAFAKVEGRFKGRDVEVSTSYAGLTGTFKVGRELQLVNVDYRIDANVSLVPSPSDSSNGLPTFQDATSLITPTPVVSNSLSIVNCTVLTKNAAIALSYVNHPTEVILNTVARSSGGGKVSVKHAAGWTGAFDVSAAPGSTS